MESIRKWLYKPKKDDKSLLAQFYHADEELNVVAGELDSFDGRKDPERCAALVNRLRRAQDRVLAVTGAIMDVLISGERADRDFRAKFPEDVLQDNLAGQLWFGAECLAAGSSIMNREAESIAMRPLAQAVTKSLENVRNLLRDTCLRNNTPNGPIELDSNELVTEMLLESLKIFDKLFAEFELAYVSAMVPVKSTQEYELQELIGVLFSETLQRALKMKILTQEMVDDCDPALMFTIPRLAIVSGLLIFPDGPLSIDKPLEEMSEMFRPFRTVLHKIRELLLTLNTKELYMLEKLLCDNEQINDVKSVSDVDVESGMDEFVNQFYKNPNTSANMVTKSTEKSVQPIHRNPNNVVDTPSTSGYSNSTTTLIPNDDLESPNDSGICTETTSLDRSPSLELNDTKNYSCTGNGSLTLCTKSHKKLIQSQADFSLGSSRSIPKTAFPARKNKVNGALAGGTSDEESSSADSSETDHSNDEESTESTSTSSYNSNCVDEELALAMQSAEITSRNEIRVSFVRRAFNSTEDMLHSLFVCIAGVADQLQTTFACDLRNILKAVFLINATDTAATEPEKSLEPVGLEASIEYHPAESDVIENNEFSVDPNILAQEALFDSNVYFQLVPEDCPSEYTNYQVEEHALDSNRYAALRHNIAQIQTDIAQSRSERHDAFSRPPAWIPDIEAPKCMSCGATFTVVKRRHHCRNCGKVFCASCSSNSVPLPKFGHIKPVRVCNKCFIYSLTPFTM